MSHTFELCSEIVRILKPKGKMFAKEKTTNVARLASNFKLAGFCDVVCYQSQDILEVSAGKPDFEIGSSSKLSFGNPAVAPVWSLGSSLVDDDVELINEDDLLDEDDLLKPNADSLKGIKYHRNY